MMPYLTNFKRTCHCMEQRKTSMCIALAPYTLSQFLTVCCLPFTPPLPLPLLPNIYPLPYYFKRTLHYSISTSPYVISKSACPLPDSLSGTFPLAPFSIFLLIPHTISTCPYQRHTRRTYQGCWRERYSCWAPSPCHRLVSWLHTTPPSHYNPTSPSGYLQRVIESFISWNTTSWKTCCKYYFHWTWLVTRHPGMVTWH